MLARLLTDRGERVDRLVVSMLVAPQVRTTVGNAAGVAPVTGLIPLSLATGNVTVAVAALSDAGTLAVTVVADPLHNRDLDVLVTALREELTGSPDAAARGHATPASR